MSLRILFPLAILLAAFTSHANAQGSMRVGVLECDVAGGVGFIFGSTKSLRCVYNPAGGRYQEVYTGRINKYGIDIGATSASRIVWAVFAPSSPGRGALAGTYVGATAEATAGVGLGANALVGSGNSISLNPLSIQGQTGVNVAAGVAGLTLELAQ